MDERHAEIITTEGFKTSFERFSSFKFKDSSKYITFGNKFLDAAMKGIAPHDLVLLGAYSGAGKTQFCVNLALQNIKRGKRVHFIALEAEPGEIEDRLRFSDVLGRYYADRFRPQRKAGEIGINYHDYICGEFEEFLEAYEYENPPEYYLNLKTFYKEKVFDIESLTNLMYGIHAETDLIIVDHIHYFDYDDAHENQSLKLIAKRARQICLEIGKPMILISHMRKKDRKSLEAAPGLDEFHGSSDLTKIATKVLTLARGEFLGGGQYETLCRIPKCRIDGSVTNFVGKLIFDAKQNIYLNPYTVGRIGLSSGDFQAIEEQEKLPDFIKRRTIYD